MNKKRVMHYGYAIVAAVFTDLLVCGGIFFGASGVFIVPVSTSLDIGQGDFSMYLTIQSFTIAIGVMIAPKLLSRHSYKKLNAVSSLIAGCGFILMGFAQSVIFLYIGGIMIGLGCVFLTYLIAGTLLPRWFKQKLGTAIAIAMSGLGLGGIIFNPIISYLVNMNNTLGFNEGWRFAYGFLGIVVIVICLPVALFVIKDYPSDKGLLPYGYENTNNENTKRIVEGVSKNNAVKSVSFFWYSIMVICFTLSGAIMTYLPAFSANSSSANISGIIGSVGMLGAIIGGFLIGVINDRFGAHIGSLFAGGCGVIGFVLMIIGSNQAYILLLGTALYGIFYQINQVQMPAMVSSMYGEYEYDKIFPLGATVSPWVGAISYSLWGFLFDATQSYNVMLIVGLICGVLTAVTGVLAMISSRKLPRETVEIE